MEETTKKNLIMRFRKAKKDALIATNELYSLGDMNIFDTEGALRVMTSEEFIKNSNAVKTFNKEVRKQLEDVQLKKPFEEKDYRSKINQISCIMTNAAKKFDFSNPILAYIGEEE